LLIGQVIDTNSAWIGQQMSLLGIRLEARLAVGDDEQEIRNGLQFLRTGADIIFLTGGLGPTRDDITKKTLCGYFGGKLIENEAVKQDVTGFFERVKRPLLESNLQQAMVPDCCEVIRNPWGTAPAMWFEQEGKIFVSMPGVPFEMKNLMTERVIPRIRERFQTGVILHRTLLTAGIGESFLAEKLRPFEDQLPEGFKLAYLPNLSQVRLRLSATGPEGKRLQVQMDEQVQYLESLIREDIFGYEEDTLEKVIGTLLNERGETLSLAESCTGGNIARRITSIPGSSAYFPGSVVSYSYEMKKELLQVKDATLEQFGAVSEETVKEMSAGCRVRFHSDYSIAVSGIAGPGGGTTDKPVGTVWIAVRTPDKVYTRLFHFSRNRQQNIEMTTIAALNLLRKILLGTVI